MSKARRLFILDSMAIIFRSYHALASGNLSREDGLPTSAIYGTTSFLLKLIEKEKPDFLVAATDRSEPTFRHERYSEYKANRSDMPEDLAQQIPHVYELFKVLQIPLLSVAGFEADDLIGSFAKRYASASDQVYIVSGDKDFCQLLSKNIFLYKTQKNDEAQIIGPKEVQEKYGCKVEEFRDYLAILGDSIDNIPGVKGVGQKGAAKLIAEFGSLEGIYENLDKIKNKRQKTALENGRESAFLSKELVTIPTDLDLKLDLEKLGGLTKRETVEKSLEKYLTEMNFNSLKKKVLEAKKGRLKTESQKSYDEKSASYTCIKSMQDWELFKERLRDEKIFSFDTETTGLDAVSSEPIGISFSFENQSAYYLPLIAYTFEELALDLVKIKEDLKEIFADQNKTKIAHNLKFDVGMLENMGIEVSIPYEDTMLLSHVADATRSSHVWTTSLSRFSTIKQFLYQNSSWIKNLFK